MVLISILAGADSFGTAVVTNMILIGILVSTVGLVATVVAGMILILIATGTDSLGTAIVTGVVLIGVLVSTKVYVATVIAIMILICVCTGIVASAIYGTCAIGITNVILAVVAAGAQRLAAAIVTDMVAVVILIGAGANELGAAIITGMIYILIDMGTLIGTTAIVADMVCILILVAGGIDGLGVGCTAASSGTGEGLLALYLALGIGGHFAVVPGVHHSVAIFVTAVDTLEGMGSFLAIAVTLDCAGVGMIQLRNHKIIIVDLAVSGIRCGISCKVLATDGTLLVSLITGCKTGGILGRNFLEAVAQSSSQLFAADRTSLDGGTGSVCAGGMLGLCAILRI